MVKLRAGVGAEASILTRFIKPEQTAPRNDHRSNVILDSRFEDQNGKQHFRFQYAGDNVSGQLLSGLCRWVKVTKEGNPSLYFEGLRTSEKQSTDEDKEPQWKNSVAKKLLYKDIKEGRVPLNSREMPLQEIYCMHPEYADYKYEKFSSRVSSTRKTIRKNILRAEEDKAAFDLYVENNEVSYHSHKGYIQWQGSESQRLLRDDITDGLVEQMGKMELWESRREYQGEFPLKVFRDKIYQEIGTAKYLHTLRVMGKQFKSS